MTYDRITANIATVERQLNNVDHVLRTLRDTRGAAAIERAIKSYEDMHTRMSGKLQDLHLEREALDF